MNEATKNMSTWTLSLHSPSSSLNTPWAQTVLSTLLKPLGCIHPTRVEMYEKGQRAVVVIAFHEAGIEKDQLLSRVSFGDGSIRVESCVSAVPSPSTSPDDVLYLEHPVESSRKISEAAQFLYMMTPRDHPEYQKRKYAYIEASDRWINSM